MQLLQELHSFLFTGNRLKTRSQYLWPTENAHTLYSNIVAAHMATPTATPTARGLLNGYSHDKKMSTSVSLTHKHGRRQLWLGSTEMWPLLCRFCLWKTIRYYFIDNAIIGKKLISGKSHPQLVATFPTRLKLTVAVANIWIHEIR